MFGEDYADEKSGDNLLVLWDDGGCFAAVWILLMAAVALQNTLSGDSMGATMKAGGVHACPLGLHANLITVISAIPNMTYINL